MNVYQIKNLIVTLACIFYFSIAGSFMWEIYKSGLLK